MTSFNPCRGSTVLVSPTLTLDDHPCVAAPSKSLKFIPMAFLSNTPTLSLSQLSGSFPFQPKYIPFLTCDVKIILGSEPPATGSGTSPAALASNGWFVPNSSSVLPIPVSTSHSEVWWDGRQVSCFTGRAKFDFSSPLLDMHPRSGFSFWNLRE